MPNFSPINSGVGCRIPKAVKFTKFVNKNYPQRHTPLQIILAYVSNTLANPRFKFGRIYSRVSNVVVVHLWGCFPKKISTSP